jgi:hypothetical protein
LIKKYEHIIRNPEMPSDNNMEISIFDYIGFFGPIIVIIISITKLWNQPQYLIGYACFEVINGIINSVLKSRVDTLYYDSTKNKQLAIFDKIYSWFR